LGIVLIILRDLILQFACITSFFMKVIDPLDNLHVI